MPNISYALLQRAMTVDLNSRLHEESSWQLTSISFSEGRPELITISAVRQRQSSEVRDLYVYPDRLYFMCTNFDGPVVKRAL